MHSILPLANFEVGKQPAFVLLRVKCPRLVSSTSACTLLSIPSPLILRRHSYSSEICGGPSVTPRKRSVRLFRFIGSFVAARRKAFSIASQLFRLSPSSSLPQPPAFPLSTHICLLSSLITPQFHRHSGPRVATFPRSANSCTTNGDTASRSLTCR